MWDSQQTGEGFSPVEAEGPQMGCWSSGLHQPGWEGGEFTQGDVMRAGNCSMLPHEAELYAESGRFVSSSDPHLAPRCGLDHLFCCKNVIHGKDPVSGGL